MSSRRIVIAKEATVTYPGSKPILTFRKEIHIATNPGVTLLAGRNGEGKTTLMRYLCGCQPEKPVAPHYTHAYLPEELRLPEELTPSTLARAMVVTDHGRAWFFEKQLALELPNLAFGKLSKGNRQKLRVLLTLAVGIANKTQLVCMDEAMSGLDYAVRRRLWQILGEESRRTRLLVSLHPDDVRLDPDQILLVRRGSVSEMPPTRSWPEIEAQLES